MSELQLQLRSLLANRHTPETRAFYERLLGYIDRRARSVWFSCYRDLLGEAEIEEAVSEVLKRLVTGALARFRGESMGELLAFVRTVTDRCVWRIAQRRLRERKTLEGEGAEDARSWYSAPGEPMDSIELVPDPPLSEADQLFLGKLLEAESKVEYSRRHGVSRAAVTQRVQRVRARIAALSEEEQRTVDAWLQLQARRHLERTEAAGRA